MRRPQRTVLLVAPRHPSASGGSTVMSNLAQAFTTAGFQAKIVSVYPGERPDPSVDVVFRHERLQRRPVSSWGLPRLATIPIFVMKRVTRRLALRALRRSIERLGHDDVVIFSHVLGKQVLDESGYKTHANGPLLIGQHHSSFESLDDEPWLREALPRHFADCDAFVALTKRDARLFGTLLPTPCVDIPNPSAPHHATGDTGAHRAVALARLSHEKQIPRMVEMFIAATSRPDLGDWTLAIYGDGPEMTAVCDTVRRLDSRNAVTVAGRTDCPRRALDGAALNLLTSTFEGFGMSVLEASQAGIPTVAFDCSDGVHEQLADAAGWLVPPQNETEYVDALRSAMSDESERSRRGERARKRAESYSPDRVLNAWTRLFDDLRTRAS